SRSSFHALRGMPFADAPHRRLSRAGTVPRSYPSEQENREIASVRRSAEVDQTERLPFLRGAIVPEAEEVGGPQPPQLIRIRNDHLHVRDQDRISAFRFSGKRALGRNEHVLLPVL